MMFNRFHNETLPIEAVSELQLKALAYHAHGSLGSGILPQHRNILTRSFLISL